MAAERYHEAAKEGILDILRECTRKDCNTKDEENGMTPVLWSAYEGHVEALRLLIGKGGDPDRADQFGNTALHLAAARGHMSCIDFLVKFGCNLFAIDIDNHTAKELAAINNRDEILRYLDAATSHMEAADKKNARNMKEKARKEAEKRAKEYAKKQTFRPGDPIKLQAQTKSTNVLQSWKQKLWSGSQGNLKHAMLSEFGGNHNTIADPNKRYSSIVNGGTISTKGAVQRKVLKAKQQETDDFKIGEIEPSGKRSVRSIQGLRRDSEILYVGTYDTAADNPGKRGKITDVFDNSNVHHDNGTDSSDSNSRTHHGTLSRSISQPDFLHTTTRGNDTDEEQEALENNLLNRQANGNIFNRPLLGTLSIPRSVSAALTAQQMEHSSDRSSSNESTSMQSNKYRNGGHHLRGKGTRQLPLVLSETDSEDDTSNMDDSADGLSSIERFLIAWGLADYIKIFDEQQIDLETLMLLTESDLKSLSLPLGPFRKLCVAIQERRNALQNPGVISDTRL